MSRGRLRLSGNEWEHAHVSFAQLGEDRVLEHLLDGRVPERHYYVDVGAFDPARYSNTLLLYKRGWRGLNIDANRAAIARFECARPRDISVCTAVSENDGETLRYLNYEQSATNRIVPLTDGTSPNLFGHPVLSSYEIQASKLVSLLDRYALHFGEREFGFLNIDCEGHDLVVLASNDFNRYRPLAIAIEAHDPAMQETIRNYLVERGYRQHSQLLMTLIFRRVDQGG